MNRDTVVQNKFAIFEAMGRQHTHKGADIFSKRFDCDWKSFIYVEDTLPNGCEKCHVCKYLDFLDYASSVAPSGSVIERDSFIDKYLGLKGIKL